MYKRQEDWDSIKDFIRLVLKKINIPLDVNEFYHEANHENYDCYRLITSDRKVFYLKIFLIIGQAYLKLKKLASDPTT